MELMATATFGLEAVVARELKQLGYDRQSIADGRVTFEGDETAICRTNLWLRSADRVLIKMGEFPARDFGTLFDRTKALPWGDWLTVDASFPVSGKSVRSQLHSVPHVQSIVKKAIVESLKKRYQRQWFDETGPVYPIEVSILKDQVCLTIDTSGPGLHKRGYRTQVGKAPLKETLAAALVQLSFWNPERPFADPFCGTGTIPIEAALLGRNIAPGINRDFAAERWPQLSLKLWRDARQETRDLARKSLSLQLLGYDLDERALRLARTHARNAGVESDIHFQQQAFQDFTTRRQFGCLVCNPPYGERMGDRPQAETHYREMREVFDRLETWSFYVLTAHPQLERIIGRQADRRRKLYNGRIECTFYQFHGPRPPRAASIPTDTDTEEDPQTEVS